MNTYMNNENPYQTSNPLVSDAATGKVSSRSDYRAAKKELKGDSKGVDGALLGSGLNLASSAVEALDDDPDYGAADVGASTLKYASMGAVAGPWGAAAGAAVGFGVGMVQKSKFEKEEKSAKHKKEQEAGYQSSMKALEEFAGYAYGGTIQDPYSSTKSDPPVKKSDRVESFVSVDVKYAAAKALGFTPDAVLRTNAPDSYSKSDKTKVNPILREQLAIPGQEPKAYDEQFWKGKSKDNMDYAKSFSMETGGMTKGKYSHESNPLTVVDKDGKNTGMELTGGEGVFDKPFMGKLNGLISSGNYQEAGKAVQREMKTWKHK